MRMRSIATCTALAASISASYGGPCWDDLSAVQAKIDAVLEAKAAAGPPATAEAMAGTSPQPTPRSLETVEERMGEISPHYQTVNAIMLLSKPWRVRVRPMTLATRPHASRLWPTCGALLVSSLRTTLMTSADCAAVSTRTRGDRVM
jgi:hypothetical protein